MYRIQAHNLQTKRIEIFTIPSYEYQGLMLNLKNTGHYGLIEAQYLARYLLAKIIAYRGFKRPLCGVMLHRHLV
jgi:hypothetical protein